MEILLRFIPFIVSPLNFLLTGLGIKFIEERKLGECVLVTFNVVFLEPQQTVLSSTFEKIQISNISLKFNTDDLLGSEIHGQKRHFVLTFCCLNLD